MSVLGEMGLVALAVCIVTVLAGGIGLPLLRRLQVGQHVRDDGPASHLKKSGTPTFGGLFFLLPIALLGVLSFFLDERLQPLAVLILTMLLFGGVGFVDDYIKVRITKKGLSVKQKTILLLVFTALYTLYYLFFAPQQPFLLLPFSGVQIPIAGWWRLPYGLFIVVYLFFACNAVNITDGVDGLLSSVTVISTLAMGLAALMLRLAIPAARPAGWLAAAMLGGCLGFLVFNRHPAKVFMGDTGSQALGAGFAGMTLLLGAPWLFILPGIIYLADAMSVVIQVAYFKKTGGRRIFKMSPIHHHYELSGWSENKVVLVFSLVTLIGSAIGLLLLL
jgi:phospho-N-acetylmuramoyl-pentapeptide-transferase